MAFLDWLFPAAETRSATEETDLAAVLAGNNGSISVTKKEALNIPAVSAGISFISGVVGSLPVRMYRRKDDDSIEEVENDYRLRLLNDETGDLLDANQFKQSIVADMILDGAGYAYINRTGNRIKSINYVDSAYVQVIDNNDHVFKKVSVMIDGKTVDEYKVMRATRMSKNGVKGVGILNQNPVLFRAMYNALRYESSTLSSGAKRGFLKSKYKLTEEALRSLQEGWRKQSTNSDSNDVVILNEGISFEPTASTATESQLNQNKATNSGQVYSMLGLSDALFSNPSENAYINAVKLGVFPILNVLESAFNKFLLLEREKGRVFFRFDVSRITKSSELERAQSYQIALQNGWLQVDEIRKRENLQPLGLDFVKLGLSDVLYYPDTKQIYTPNTNASVNIGEAPDMEVKDEV